MPMRVVAVMLLLSAGIAAEAVSYSFVSKAMWSILSGRGLTPPIQYGVTPPGFTTMIQPQKLIPGRVYTGFATDGHGGSSGVTFGFDKNGRMTFPDSFDQ